MNLLNIITNIKTQYYKDIPITGDIISTNEISTTLTVDDDYLIGRELEITAGDNIGTYTIISNTSTSIIVNATLTTETGITGDILKDENLGTVCDDIITLLNTSNTSQLTSFEFPNYNSFFSDYSDLVTTLIQFKDSYLDSDNLETIVESLNNIYNIDPSDYKTANELNIYKLELSNFIVLVNEIQNNVLAYFKRLKILLSKFVIVDLKIQNKNWQSFYNSKSTVDKTDIDNFYQFYLDNNLEQYSLFKLSKQDEIKIQ